VGEEVPDHTQHGAQLAMDQARSPRLVGDDLDTVPHLQKVAAVGLEFGWALILSGRAPIALARLPSRSACMPKISIGSRTRRKKNANLR